MAWRPRFHPHESAMSPTYQLLGDALMELGDYAEAEEAYEQMAQRADSTRSSQLDVEARLGQIARVRGDLPAARERFAAALEHALAATPRVAAMRRHDTARNSVVTSAATSGPGDFRRHKRKVDYGPSMSAPGRITSGPCI